jgi:transketolase
MLNKNLNLNQELFSADTLLKSTQEGMGEGLIDAGNRFKSVMVLCADLTKTTKVDGFEKNFPDRFVHMGIAEQNMIGVAAGLAMEGKIPFASSSLGVFV